MSYYPTDGSRAVKPIDLATGDRVQLDGDAVQWWTVQAVSEHYAACVRPLTRTEHDEYRREYGNEANGPLYTVLDWRNGVRGPCDLIGQGWGDGTYSREECAAMLAAFEMDDDGIQVSQRNWVPLAILDHQRRGVQ